MGDEELEVGEKDVSRVDGQVKLSMAGSTKRNSVQGRLVSHFSTDNVHLLVFLGKHYLRTDRMANPTVATGESLWG